MDMRQQGQQPIVVDRRSRECDRSRQLLITTAIKTRSKTVLASSIINNSSTPNTIRMATLSASSNKMRVANCTNSNRLRRSSSRMGAAAISRRRGIRVTKPSYCNSNRECSSNLIDTSSKRTSHPFRRPATRGRQRIASEPRKLTVQAVQVAAAGCAP